MAANHHFSEPVEIRRDELFTTNRRVNGLDLNLHNSYVKDVTDSESPWTSVAELGAAITFGGASGALGVAVNGAAVRSVLRPPPAKVPGAHAGASLHAGSPETPRAYTQTPHAKWNGNGTTVEISDD